MMMNVRSRTFFKSRDQVSPRPLRLSPRLSARSTETRIRRVTLALVDEGFEPRGLGPQARHRQSKIKTLAETNFGASTRAGCTVL